jgi:2-dehydropantoate 2-reductase
MKIAIFGAGGVGGYFGGRLAEAGQEVHFIARGEHLKAIKKNGLQIFSVNGDYKIQPALATDDPTEIGPVDYVIVAVKHYHLSEATPLIKPLLNEYTTVVPLLNGVDAQEILMNVLGSSHVVGGLCSLVAMIEVPGIIRQPSLLHRVVVGELDHTKSDRVEKLIQAWQSVGVEAIHAPDIHIAMWTKFIFIATFGGISSLARANMGEIRDNPETKEIYLLGLREVEALARVQGIDLPQDVIDNILILTDNFEPTTTSSMQRDVAAGNPFELEAFNGTVAKLGKQYSVPTPVHKSIYALLKPALNRVMS